MGGGAPPGARASRPHALPYRAAQYACDVTPGYPAGWNAKGLADAESWRRCRSSGVEEMAEGVPELMRARCPRSRVGPAHVHCRIEPHSMPAM